MMISFGQSVIVVLSFISSIVCTSLVDQVYVELAPEKTICFRLLNATHSFGCQSDRHGNVGVVIRVRERGDLDGISDCWERRFPDYNGNGGKFAVVIDKDLLTSETVTLLREASCVSVVLLSNSDRLTSVFSNDKPRSEDQSCPNRHSSLYPECTGWNSKGAVFPSGMAFMEWEKPVIMLNNKTNQDLIDKCYSTFNIPANSSSTGALCAISVKGFSYAAGNSEICLRRSEGRFVDLDGPVSLCDILQDYNVFAAIPPKVSPKEKEEKRTAKYMVIGTRMDSLSFVPEQSPGELSSITSIITSLAAAKAISSQRNAFISAAAASDRRLIFSYFHGEAFDYIGSSRAVYDMGKEKFPTTFDAQKVAQKEQIGIDQVDAVVEVQQIGSSPSAFFAHVHGPVYDTKGVETDRLISSARSAFSALSQPFTMSSLRSLPPSSLQSIYKNGISMAGIVITQFDKEYQYSRSNSLFDTNSYSTEERKQVEEAIVAAASAIVRIAKDYVGVKGPDEITVDKEFVSSLFDCFIVSPDWWTCPLMEAVLEDFTALKPGKMEKTTYIGADGFSLIRVATYSILAHATGNKEDTLNVRSKEQCGDLNKHQTLYLYVWQRDSSTNSTHCLQTSIFKTKAASPAFIAEDNVNLATTHYSTWTETSYNVAFERASKGRSAGPRLFLVEGSNSELGTLYAGIAVAVIAMLIVGRLKEETFVFDEGEPMAEAGEPL